MQKICKRVIRNVNNRAICLLIAFHAITYNCISQQIDNDNNKIRTVVIDAGHGGKDPGAVGSFSKEKDIVLSIALKTGKYIEEKIPDVKVLYTRTTDVLVPFDERSRIANDAQADLFISIHANSNPNKKPYGTETFVMGLHKSEGNLDVAKKENSVIVYEDDYKAKYEGFDPNDVESYIMMTLMQDTYLDQSLIAASMVQDQFRTKAKRKDRGVKQAGFLVLWKTSTPSILIETGFLSNKTEEKYLASDQGQDYLASAIFRAFRDYKIMMEGGNTDVFTANSEPSQKVEESVEIKKQEVKEKQEPTPEIKETPAAEAKQSQNKPEPIKPKNTEKSDNILFKVQILYSESKLNSDNKVFKDFNDVEEISSNGKYKYLVGEKNSYNEAIEYSKWVKSRHPDAFVVAVSNGKIIPLSEVLTNQNTN